MEVRSVKWGVLVSFLLLKLNFSSVYAQENHHPININFVIHFDPLFAPQGRVKKEAYERERNNLAWLIEYLEKIEREKRSEYVPRLTLEIAGDHAEFYKEDQEGLELLKKIYKKNMHAFGVHFHTNYKEAKHVWPDYRKDRVPTRPDPVFRTRVTQDHIKEVDVLYAKVMETQDATKIRAANHIITAHLLDVEIAKTLGFDINTGGRNEVFNLFYDHDVYNPFRISRGWALAEDKNSAWLLVPQSPDLGFIGEHNPLPHDISTEYTQGMQKMIWQDISLPAMQRKFLHLYLEWLYQTKNKFAPKVWVFGWHEHTNNLNADDGIYGNPRNLRDEVMKFVKWLNENFIGKRTSDGKFICRYATVEETAKEFQEWEKVYPEKSSFNYPIKERDWKVYPYQLKGLAKVLMYSHYVEELDNFKALGVNMHKLVKIDARNWTFKNGKIVATAPTYLIYCLWSDSGKVTIDISKFIKGEVVCVNGLDAKEEMHNPSQITISETPIICREKR